MKKGKNMRVKIGDEWFDAKDAPICIRYSDEEREQIYQNTGYSYAQFPDNWVLLKKCENG